MRGELLSDAVGGVAHRCCAIPGAGEELLAKWQIVMPLNAGKATRLVSNHARRTKLIRHEPLDRVVSRVGFGCYQQLSIAITVFLLRTRYRSGLCVFRQQLAIDPIDC